MPAVEKVVEDGKEYLIMQETFKDNIKPAAPKNPQIAEEKEESPVERKSTAPKVADIEKEATKETPVVSPPSDEIDPKSVVYEENGCVKYDGTKPRVDLIPPEVIFAMGEMFRHGAEKYSDRNWEKGMKWSRVFGSTMRHLWAWWKGEDIDPESKQPHLYSAACCVAMLVAYRERKIGTDDRYNNS